MNKLLYPRLAAQNIAKNGRLYISYIITCILTIAMFYIISTLAMAPELSGFFGGSDLRIFLFLGQWIIGIFAFIFLFYTHSFIIRRRKKEFGLYNILGMEKRHIATVLFYETLYSAFISFLAGIGLGMLLYKAAQLFLLKLAKMEPTGGYFVSGSTIRNTLLMFGIIFVLTYMNTLRQLHLSSPAELLKGGQVGEKEPKARVILVILGLACLSVGYYISITTENPMAALLLFFAAVILVIIGTYCLFTSVTIAVLKALKKNKKYYYTPKHFTFVSGMLYRMKQNAVGLANICVLSTMVLVMLSTTILLYASVEDQIRTRYPRNIMVTFNDTITREDTASLKDYMDQAIASQNITPAGLAEFYTDIIGFTRDGSRFKAGRSISYSSSASAYIYLLTLEDYNRMTGRSETLDSPDDVLIYAVHHSYDEDTITIENHTFTVKDSIDDFTIADNSKRMMVAVYYVIVKDTQTFQEIIDSIPPDCSDSISSMYCYYFDLDMDKESQKAAGENLRTYIGNDPGSQTLVASPYVSIAASDADELKRIYGGLLFLGLFLGALFLMATVLIIYYKQITEGYEDQSRFEIMQNVGMSRQEVRKTIHTQVLSVFYLPYGMACIHTAFAYPIVSRLLAMLNMTNTTLFLYGLIGTMLVFGVFYTIVYLMTARVYYKIIAVRA